MPVPLLYCGELVERAYRADLIVDDALLVEVKSVQELEDIHLAQVVTYLTLTGLDVGLLVNFNVAHLKAGLTRVLSAAFASFASSWSIPRTASA